MSRRFSILILVVLIATALGVAGWLAFRSTGTHAGGGGAYSCPMHPEVTSEEPGSSCPICGMDLVSANGPTPVTAARGASCACCR